MPIMLRPGDFHAFCQTADSEGVQRVVAIISFHGHQRTRVKMQDPERPDATQPLRLFVSYARVDEAHLKRLEVYLAPLRREGLIDAWHDKMILAGSEWAADIDRNLVNADIVIILVSADLLASDYCFDRQLRMAIERHEQGQAHVIPILVRPADIERTPLANLQPLPLNGEPITAWGDQDRAWLSVAKSIRSVVTATRARRVEDLTPARERRASDALAPVVTPVEVQVPHGYSVYGSSVQDSSVTFRVYGTLVSQVKGQPNPYGQDVNLLFDITNRAGADLRICEVQVSVVRFQEISIKKLNPLASAGTIQRFFCHLESTAGCYQAAMVSSSIDYVKLRPGEMERIGIACNTLTPGIYLLGISLTYSLSGKVVQLPVGTLEGEVAFFRRPS